MSIHCKSPNPSEDNELRLVGKLFESVAKKIVRNARRIEKFFELRTFFFPATEKVNDEGRCGTRKQAKHNVALHVVAMNIRGTRS